MNGKFQNSISDLPKLDRSRYEKIFKVYNIENTPKNFYFYNITKGIKINPNDIDDSYILNFKLDRNVPWTTLAYNLYGSIYMWWIIKILNPEANIFHAEAGTTLKLIRPEYVEQVLDIINSQLSV